MTDQTIETTPEQQGNPVQQAGSKTPEQPGVNWEERYKGSVTTINRLQGEIKTLKEQLSGKTSEYEQLYSQLTQKDVEKDVAVSEHRKQLEKALTEKTTAERELTELRAFKSKMDVIREMGANHLVPIIDRIPYVEDPEALRTIIKDFSNWGDDMKKEREKEILSGITPTGVAAGSQAKPNVPSSAKEWEVHINSLPLGIEREKAWDEYFVWGQQQSRK